MRVKVEDYHIKTGNRGSCLLCPISNAVTPLLPAGQYAFVDEDQLMVYEESRLLKVCHLSDSAKKFIADFDRGKAVQPFEFDLDLS